ncbi:MAG: ABC transporter permease, partial [Lachnospiraceae bacterium]|nr:ABC transporter permease [Lachnospiraceae bacterium]
MKLRRSKFLLIGLLGTLIVPLFVYVKAVTNYLSDPTRTISVFSLYDDALMFLMLLFAPIVLTILGAWIISREYTDGTLKNIFVIPVSRTAFLCGKLLFFAMLSLLFMLLSWLEIMVLALLCNCFVPV